MAGLTSGFEPKCLFTSSETSNKLYFVSAAVKEMLAADGKGQMKTVHAGAPLIFVY